MPVLCRVVVLDELSQEVPVGRPVRTNPWESLQTRAIAGAGSLTLGRRVEKVGRGNMLEVFVSFPDVSFTMSWTTFGGFCRLSFFTHSDRCRPHL
jgi:hypothetical protein